MPAMRTTRDHGDGRSRHQERLILLVAVALSIIMFGWQGYHLYWANRTASHRHITELVESVDDAGTRQIGLVADLERAVLLSSYEGTDPRPAEWATRYEAATNATGAAVATALPEVGAALDGSIGMVDTTRIELDRRVDDVVRRLADGGDQTPAAVLDPAFLSARAAFERAVDSQMTGLAEELDAGTAAERLDELHSVTVALVLFSAAIGAWAVFLRHLRRSARRLAEEQEHRRRAELTSSQLQKTEALGLMADGVAHDVKNLTAIISGSADEVQRLLPTEHPAAVALARIQEATHQADELANGLLSFSRKSGATRGIVDLAELTTGMHHMLRYLVPRPIELVVDVPPAAWVRGDAPQLQQVLLNLVTNAREAMPDGGRITIAIRPDAGRGTTDARWMLVVEDTGQGMDPETRRHAFEPFFTTRPTGQGSGLGLAIVHRIVEEHGGTIEIATGEGEGTTFTIGLPAVAAPSLPVETRHQDGSAVLVAHPVAYVRDLIGGALVAEGHRVVSASTDTELASFVAGCRSGIDLAVVDVGLLADGRLRAAIPDDLRVVVIGESTIELGDSRNVRVLDGPLSLADLTDCVASLQRTCAAGATP